MNNVSISGRLVYEPKLLENENYKILPMRLAVSRNDKKRTTDFITAKAWGSAAEFIAKYFHKGEPIELTGRLQVDNYERADGTKVYETYVFVLECGFVLSKKDGTPAEEPKAEEPAEEPAEPQGEPVKAGDLPFEI